MKIEIKDNQEGTDWSVKSMIPEKSSNYDLPDSYDSIEQTLITADQILSDAVENAKTLFHSPTVSSIEDSKIVSRVMVLREFNLEREIYEISY